MNKMTKFEQIQEIYTMLKKYYKQHIISSVEIYERTNFEQSIKCRIDGKIWYLGEFPYEIRTVIYKLINQ